MTSPGQTPGSTKALAKGHQGGGGASQKPSQTPSSGSKSNPQSSLSLASASGAERDRGDSKDSDFAVVTVDAKRPGDSLKVSLAGSLGNPRSRLHSKMMRLETIMTYGSSLQTSGSAGKYYLTWTGPSTPYMLLSTLIASSSETASFDAVFDEFFVRDVQFVYEPYNAFGGALTDGTTVNNGQNCGLAMVGYQHAQAGPSDSSAAWYIAAASSLYKYANSGKKFSFTWKNVEKFAWDGPMGDQSTADMTTSWCSFTNTSVYGGRVYAMLPFPSGASAGLGVFGESVVLGTVLMRARVAMRIRS